MIGMKQGGHRVANIYGELRLVCGLARPSPLRIAEHFNPPVYEVDHPVLRDPRRRVPDGFTRPVELEARVGDFDDQFRGQRMRPKISEVPTHHGDVRFRLGVIIHPERHLDTHSVPVGEHPPEGLLGRLNGQRMIGALGSHFQNLAIKQLHPGAGWEHTTDHQLIEPRSSPPLRSNAHRQPPDLVYQTTLDEGTATARPARPFSPRAAQISARQDTPPPPGPPRATHPNPSPETGSSPRGGPERPGGDPAAPPRRSSDSRPSRGRRA